MWRILFVVVCFMPALAFAYVPTFVQPADVSDYQSVPTDGYIHSYYGTLNNFPHTYTLSLAASSTVSVQILVPDLVSVTNTRAGIIVRREIRGVSEVARLEPKAAPWSIRVDRETGDRYRVGGTFAALIRPGTYHIEVSTPDNLGPYVVQIGAATGTVDTIPSVPRGYFGKLHDIYAIKRFFGEPWYAVMGTADYYIPLLVLLAGIVGWVYYRKRHYGA